MQIFLCDPGMGYMVEKAESKEVPMKILIYGAGVVGSFFAAQLKNCGHDVSILARGNRLCDIQKHGIILEDALKGGQTSTYINVVETLEPEDAYDFVLVAMRKNNIQDILPVLAKNQKIPYVIFMVNNAAGPDEYRKALGPDRVLLSFSATGGVRKGHVIRCLIAKKYKIPLGGINNQKTPHITEIVKAFEQANIDVQLYDMDAWLKYHVALVSPIANAILVTGDNYQLAGNTQIIRLMIRAVKEGFTVLEKLGYAVTPRMFVVLKWLPEWVLEILVKRALNTKRAEIALTGHALHAVDEMKHLSHEFKTLVDKAGIYTPAINELHEKVNIKFSDK
jgi:2-dehydropantoate 2-reductase